MPARELELDPKIEDLAAEEAAAPQAAEAHDESFKTEGALPEVAPDEEVAPVPGLTASGLAYDYDGTGVSTLDKGVHHWEKYKLMCEQAGKPEKWDDSYRRGYTSAAGWELGRRDMSWTLKKGQSASKAVTEFLTGPSVADYRVASVAAGLDELRDEIGDAKFDKMFGSSHDGEDAAIAVPQRLQLNAEMYTVPYYDQMKAIIAEADQKANKPTEPVPQPVVEHKEKPEEKAALAQEAPEHAAVIAQELGVDRRDREIV